MTDVDWLQAEVRRLHALAERLQAEIADLRRDRNMPYGPPSGPLETTKPPAAAPGQADPDTAPQDPARTNTYLNAISAVGSGKGDPQHWVKFSTRRAIADAVVAVADAEQAGLKAEVYRLGLFGDVVQDLAADLAKTEVEVERLKADATWDRLAAETGAERAQGEYDRLWEVVVVVRAQRDEARATIERVRALHRITPEHFPGCGRSCEACRQVWPCSTICAFNAVTRPTPGSDESPYAISPTPDGYGLWLADRGLTAHDPPGREPEDPLAATRARLEKAMRGMEATT